MIENDIYLTLKEECKGFYKEKGSKFIARAYNVNNETDVKDRLLELRKEYSDARHHCYAYMLGQAREQYRANDDGEPNNSAGMPILGQLNSNNLTNVLVVVIRYFGGTKLGVGGLISAYKIATADAINNGEIIERTVNHQYKILFSYPQMSAVMRIVKEEGLLQLSQSFETDCVLNFEVRRSNAEFFLEKLARINNIKTEFVTES